MKVLCALLLFAIAPASCLAYDVDGSSPKSSFSTDQSDLWWNRNESGWGMQLVQQGPTIFATLFIYRQDGEPLWVTATLAPVGSLTWSGTLYLTSGPWFGGAFDQTTVTTRAAGTMTYTSLTVNTGTVTYSIDGVSVTKQITRQLLTYDNYNGAYGAAVNLTQSNCFLPAANGFFNGAMAIAISHTNTTMSQVWTFPAGQVCTFSGTYSQAGRMGTFDGNYSCSTGEVGHMHFFEMTNRVGMISGRMTGSSTNIGCQYTGRFTGLDPSKP